MSEKFNIGDRVRRIDGSYKYMNVGDEDVVTGYTNHGGVILKHYEGGHGEDKLELVEAVTSTFKIGVRVRLKYYAEYIDHEDHDGQSARITEVRETAIQIMWEDKTISVVSLNGQSKPYVVDELKNNKMDINDVSKLDSSVVKKAKANVLKARKELQTEQAEAVLTELFNTKDAIEEKIGEDQNELDSVSEDIAVFDVK